jgi:hypothetical protein
VASFAWLPALGNGQSSPAPELAAMSCTVDIMQAKFQIDCFQATQLQQSLQQSLQQRNP